MRKNEEQLKKQRNASLNEEQVRTSPLSANARRLLRSTASAAIYSPRDVAATDPLCDPAPYSLPAQKELDSNGDGIVSAEELFHHVDKDGDELLTDQEFEQAMRLQGHTHQKSLAVLTHRSSLFGDAGSVKRTVDGVLRFRRDNTAHATNPGCLCIFLLWWLGMVVIAAIGVTNGDPVKLLFAHDAEGNTCGKGPLRDKKLVYYPRLESDMLKYAARPSTHSTPRIRLNLPTYLPTLPADRPAFLGTRRGPSTTRSTRRPTSS
jgi:hypothetical protein